MNQVEHLLVIVAEEAAEVAQRCTKALRFGLQEIQPGQGLTNAERIVVEFSYLVATMEMLNKAQRLNGSLCVYPDEIALESLKLEKKAKLEKFLAYSQKLGTLEKLCI